MKIYKPIPTKLVRLQIVKHPQKRLNLSLCETTPEKCFSELKEIIKPFIDPFGKGGKTAINIREVIDGKNGKSVTLSFYGLNPEEVLNILIEKIEVRTER